MQDPHASAPVILVGVAIGKAPQFDDTLDELALLAESSGDRPVARVIARRPAPDAALFIGSGKAEEIQALIASHQAQAVLFDQVLSPIQQRNLERLWGVPVTDRTGLILEIFAARAQSHEGKLQVELAQLQYLATRLVRRWSHLERQQGGIGTRGGPGERQIELDRRMIDERIKALKERLSKVKRQRGTQRRSRQRNDTFRVALVGYTNAGKSTLFNALVKARAYAADQLFATLDTTTRQLWLQDLGRAVSLSDTVGFIRDLPHKLVDAFEATLLEAADADLLLHVVDAAGRDRRWQMAEVDRVLEDIQAHHIPQIVVFNKMDLWPDGEGTEGPTVWEDAQGRALPCCGVSARTGQGLEALRQAITEHARHGPRPPPPETDDPRGLGAEATPDAL